LKRRILFVDDEANILSGLRRMLRVMREEWDMAFVESGTEALKLLAAEPYDVIISDMRMPGMDGAQLLAEVSLRHPEMVRIILSGQSEETAVLKTVRHAHQFLAKACNPDEIKSTITRSMNLRTLLNSRHLQKLVSRIDSLPSLPSLYSEIMEELRSPQSSIKRVGQIIARDAGMSAKILQLVNSAFFGLSRQISSVTEAVNYLGIDTIKSLALSVQIFSSFDAKGPAGSAVSGLWDHSLRVGLCARAICKAEIGSRGDQEDAFTAGLLHDVGKLIFMASFTDVYLPVYQQAGHHREDLLSQERQNFEATHAEVGAYLLGLWGLPDGIVEAVGFHHVPEASMIRNFGPLAAVHVGNNMDHLIAGASDLDSAGLFSETFMTDAALMDKLPAWRSLCVAALSQEDSDG